MKPVAGGTARPIGVWVPLAAQLLLFLLRVRSFPFGYLRPETIPLVVTQYAWLGLVTLLCIPLWQGKRWAWSAFVAVFFCRVAGELAALFILFDNLGRYRASRGVGLAASQMLVSMIGEHVLMTLLSSCTGALLFRTADWFGVEHRRAWRTTFREAWWAWMLCGVMGVALPLVSQLARGFSHP